MLLLLGRVRGRSGCGAAALWCTTHAGFAPCSPTFRVPLCTSRASSADVFTDLFGRKLRHGRSRKRRSERGRHHAKGTRYVGELQIWPSGWTHELPFSQLRILYSHTYDQLAARARAERQRAARARVGHPAGAAGAAAAAAAFPGARRTADPARAPRQVRVLDAPHVCAACPALALAQGGAPRAFLVGLGGRVLASSCSQPYSMPPIVPHVPVIPHGRQWSQHGEEGARRPWGAPGWRAQTAPCS